VSGKISYIVIASSDRVIRDGIHSGGPLSINATEYEWAASLLRHTDELSALLYKNSSGAVGLRLYTDCFTLLSTYLRPEVHSAQPSLSSPVHVALMLNYGK